MSAFIEPVNLPRRVDAPNTVSTHSDLREQAADLIEAAGVWIKAVHQIPGVHTPYAGGSYGDLVEDPGTPMNWLAGPAIFILAATRFIEDADRFLGLSRITEFRRVVQHENGALGCGEALTSGLKMPGQNRHLIHSPVRKKSVRSLCVGPVLTGQGDRLPQPG